MLAWALLAMMLSAGENLAPNGDLEVLADGYFADWSGGWCRDGEEHFTADVATDDPHSGERCLHFKHTGERDWAIYPGGPRDVRGGDVNEMSVWVRIAGAGHVVLGASVHPPGQGEAGVQWVAAGLTVRGPVDTWRELRTTLVIDDGMVRALPRLIGDRPVEAWIDDFSVVAAGNTHDRREAYDGPRAATIRSPRLTLDVSAFDGSYAVTDARTGRRWSAAGSVSFLPVSAESDGAAVLVRCLSVVGGREELFRYEVSP